MTISLIEALRNIASVPKTEEELKQGVRNLTGFARCMLSVKQEIKENESRHTDTCVNQNAGRAIEPARSK